MKKLILTGLTALLAGCATPSISENWNLKKFYQESNVGITQKDSTKPFEDTIDETTHKNINELYDLLIADHKYEEEKRLGVSKVATVNGLKYEITAFIPNPGEKGALSALISDKNNNMLTMSDNERDGRINNVGLHTADGKHFFPRIISEKFNNEYHDAVNAFLSLEKAGKTEHLDHFTFYDGKILSYTPLLTSSN